MSSKVEKFGGFYFDIKNVINGQSPSPSLRPEQGLDVANEVKTQLSFKPSVSCKLTPIQQWTNL